MFGTMSRITVLARLSGFRNGDNEVAVRPIYEDQEWLLKRDFILRILGEVFFNRQRRQLKTPLGFRPGQFLSVLPVFRVN
jgi:hypothetical protein